MIADERALYEYVTRQRWYGAKSRPVTHSTVLDTVTIRQAEPRLELALVELRYDTGAHDIYQLVFSGRDDAGFGGLAEDPSQSRELVSAMRAGLTLQGSQGVVEFRPAEDFSALGRELGAARLVASEQSNSSVIFDEALILKVFRRLEPGVNPELELLRFLSERGFRNIPALGGWYSYSGGPLAATLGLLQEYRADAVDGWLLALDEIGSAPERFLDRLERLGEVTGQMHSVLGSDVNDPAFAPEEPSVESLGLLTATVDEEIARVFLSLPEDDEALAPILGRGEEVRERLRLLAHSGSTGRIIRTHGDFHLGQTLVGGNDWVVLDFEGEPARTHRRAAPQALAAPGRRRDASLLRLRRDRGGADARRRRSGRLGGARPRPLPRGLPRDDGHDAPAVGRRRGRAAACGLRAREGGLRASLRARPPSRLGANPGRGHRADAGPRRRDGVAGRGDP